MARFWIFYDGTNLRTKSKEYNLQFRRRFFARFSHTRRITSFSLYSLSPKSAVGVKRAYHSNVYKFYYPSPFVLVYGRGGFHTGSLYKLQGVNISRTLQTKVIRIIHRTKQRRIVSSYTIRTTDCFSITIKKYFTMKFITKTWSV